MIEEDAARIAREVFRALDGRQLKAAAVLFDDSSVLRLPGRSGLAGAYQGRDAIVGLLGEMAALTRGTLRFTAGRVTRSAPGSAAVGGRAEALRRSRRLDAGIEVVVTIDGGLAREISITHDDQAHVDEFWS